jgi:CSLREA domain-containing protein
MSPRPALRFRQHLLLRRAKMNRQRSASLVLALVLATASGPSRAHNLRADCTLAVITVNSTADVAADDGQCTLREAIVAANTDTASGGAPGECAAGNGGDSVNLTGITGTITLTSPLPNITSDIVFSGPGSGHLTVWRDSLSGNYRILTVDAGAVVTIWGLTISDGLVVGDDNGGGIYNAGTLMLINTTISDNEAVGDGTFAGTGGGIYNLGTVELIDSTISRNEASDYGGGVYNDGVDSTAMLTNSTCVSNTAMHGGGLFNDDGTVALTNSTISGNEAVRVGDYGGVGGGIRNHYGTVELTSSTISGNSAETAGGGIYSLGTVELVNTIVADQLLGADCSADLIISNGYNLDGDGSCGLSASGDLTADPMLGPLQDNGGPTETRALLHGSPAIDAIPTGSCTDHQGRPVTTDQRGVPRPQGAACDVGAYEAVHSALHLPLVVYNYAPPVAFPLYIGDAIPERDVAYQGEVFYTTLVQIPGQLSSGGHFYFSSQRDTLAEVMVDDELVVLLDGAEVFAYDFSTSGTPVPATVEVPRATMEQLAGRTVTIEYRDVYGSVVGASAMWLIWVP